MSSGATIVTWAAWKLLQPHPVEADRPVPWPFVLAVTLVLTTLYFDAVLTKLASQMWRNGTAVWVANFIPYVARFKVPHVFESQAMSTFLTYATFVYEGLFPLILLRPLRKAWALAGIALHLGITLLLPLTYFGLVMCAPVLLYLGDFQGAPATPLPPTGGGWRRRAYPALLGVYSALILVAYSDMKLQYLPKDPLCRFLGVAPTGVYSRSAAGTSPARSRSTSPPAGGSRSPT